VGNAVPRLYAGMLLSLERFTNRSVGRGSISAGGLGERNAVRCPFSA
jgi:hypothetical protein